MNFTDILDTLPHAFGLPHNRAVIRQQPEDFIVNEVLGFEPDGAGEHVLLHIQKRLKNTQDVIKSLTQLFDLRSTEIGYCGLKDNHAVTTQWISIQQPVTKPFDAPKLGEGISVLEVHRHGRKLRPGAHAANRFLIRLRAFEGSRESFEVRVEQIRQYGFPNYFGEQRFGRNNMNLINALRVSHKPNKRLSRQQRSLYLSAARSFLFNVILSERVRTETWQTPQPGEPLMLAGSNQLFCEQG